MATSYLDLLLFGVIPYLSFFVFALATIQRYRSQPFTYSSLSSQFLENQHHFWGLVPFHYGLLVVLAGHLVAFLIPRQLLLWNSRPLRLYVLEAVALIFGLLTLIGLANAVIRRFGDAKVRKVTSVVDWFLLALLLVQVISGLIVAVFYPWGSSWFAASAAPYLGSLLRFNPGLGYVAAMPFWVKLHLVNAFFLLGLTPFTRLVHVLVVPVYYLWRRSQVVRWYRHPSQQK